MKRPPDGIVDFRTDDTSVVLDHMRALESARDGWMNLNPVVDEEDLPRRSGLDALLAGRLPVLPVATWVPGEHKRGRTQPSSIGIEHPVGKKVARRLGDAGLRPPPGWQGKQDHPRRGLIVTSDGEADVDAVLAWVLGVLVELSPTELDGDWRAGFHVR